MAEGWMIGTCSVIGPSHVRRGLPNQDAAAVRPAGNGSSSLVYGALSDGHGASPHFRPDRGSKIAVQSALDLLEWTAESSEDIDMESLARTVVESWRKGVDEDVARAELDRLRDLLAEVLPETLSPAPARTQRAAPDNMIELHGPRAAE